MTSIDSSSSGDIIHTHRIRVVVPKGTPSRYTLRVSDVRVGALEGPNPRVIDPSNRESSVTGNDSSSSTRGRVPKRFHPGNSTVAFGPEPY